MVHFEKKLKLSICNIFINELYYQMLTNFIHDLLIQFLLNYYIGF